MAPDLYHYRAEVRSVDCPRPADYVHSLLAWILQISELEMNQESDEDLSASQSRATPLVTIGLPVYNGDNYLADALDSILAQTFRDFELIISDNASTDRTEEICRRYASMDERIHYYRHTENRGASPNYNFTVANTRGRYFKWMAHDDVLHPRFLEETVKVLENDPEVSLAYSMTRRIGPEGEVLGTYERLEQGLRIGAPRPSTRFGDYICKQHMCLGIFGLMRLDQLLETNLHAAHQGADRVLLAEMALKGRIHRVPEYLFDRRDHPDAYSAQRRGGNRIAWWDTAQADRIRFPHWRGLLEYIKVLRRSELSGMELVRSYAMFGRWLVTPRWYRQRWVRLLTELGRGLGAALLRLLRKPAVSRSTQGQNR